MTHRRTHSRMLISALGVLSASVLALVGSDPSSGQEPKPPVEHYFSFKGKPEAEGWKIVGSDKLVRFEENGLRITLDPPIHHSATGLSTGVRVVGDFEISVNYEILKEVPEPGDPFKTATRIALLVKLERDKNKNTGGMARRITEKKGPRFTSWTTLWDATSNKKDTIGKELEASARNGRMRIVRTGSEISYFVSEGKDPDFHLMKSFDFPTDPIQDVELLANTGGPKGALDVRLTDLRIRAGPPEPAPGPVEKPGDPPPSRGWLLALVLIGAALVVVFLGVIVALIVMRRRSGSAPAKNIAIECPGCGRQLTINQGLAGKKVKCAKCGKVVPVPATAAEGATSGE